MAFLDAFLTSHGQQASDRGSTYSNELKHLIHVSRQIDVVGTGWQATSHFTPLAVRVSHDEALPTMGAIESNIALGKEFCRDVLNVSLSVAWQVFSPPPRPPPNNKIDTFGHSHSTAVALAKHGFDAIVYGRVDHHISREMSRTRRRDVLLTPSDAPQIFAHFLHGDTYVSPPFINFKKVDVRALSLRDVDAIAAALVRDASLRPAINRDILFLLGDDFATWGPLQFAALEAVLSRANEKATPSLHFKFSTPSAYVAAVRPYAPHAPSFAPPRSDLFPYEDRLHDNVWSGYFATQPLLKNKITEAERAVSAAMVLRPTVAEGGVLLRAIARLQHHDAITGTSSAHALAALREEAAAAERRARGVIAKELTKLFKGTVYSGDAVRACAVFIRAGLTAGPACFYAETDQELASREIRISRQGHWRSGSLYCASAPLPPKTALRATFSTVASSLAPPPLQPPASLRFSFVAFPSAFGPVVGSGPYIFRSLSAASLQLRFASALGLGLGLIAPAALGAFFKYSKAHCKKAGIFEFFLVGCFSGVALMASLPLRKVEDFRRALDVPFASPAPVVLTILASGFSLLRSPRAAPSLSILAAVFALFVASECTLLLFPSLHAVTLPLHFAPNGAFSSVGVQGLSSTTPTSLRLFLHVAPILNAMTAVRICGTSNSQLYTFDGASYIQRPYNFLRAAPGNVFPAVRKFELRALDGSTLRFATSRSVGVAQLGGGGGCIDVMAHRSVLQDDQRGLGAPIVDAEAAELEVAVEGGGLDPSLAADTLVFGCEGGAGLEGLQTLTA